jgi:Uma2 family endonuclease
MPKSYAKEEGSMATVTQPRATIDDLYRVDGKAELIGGRIVRFMPTGYKPGRVAFRIARRLDDHAETIGRGVTCADNMGFTVSVLRSGRQSFSSDAAYYLGPLPKNEMKFIHGAPTFAVEVRSENDYGPAAEREMAAKRADYFEAGTLVVWDVDPLAGSIHVYRPDQSVTYTRGDTAEAEPAVPGWRVAVDEVMG